MKHIKTSYESILSTIINFVKPYFYILCLLVSGTALADLQKLIPSDGKEKDYFGYSVAVDKNTVLVGANRADHGETPDAGAGYVYELGADGWQLQAKLIAQNPSALDTLGGNVALNNNTAVLGAIGRSDNGEKSGAVMVFERNHSWQQKHLIMPSDGKAGDAFGQSIALTENVLVIGAPHSDTPDKDSGSVYVYTRKGERWIFETKLTAHDGATGDLFGISVAIDKNTILVGADLNDEKAENAGAVYVFSNDGEQWQQQAKLTASDAGNTDIFGVRVAISENTALISARRDDDDKLGVDAGSAYIFERTGQQWRQKTKLLAPDGKADDRFARGVALEENTAIISAMHHDAAGKDAGAVYVYNLRNGKWSLSSKILADDSKVGDRLGWNVALSPDHIVMASPHSDNNGIESGAVYIKSLTTK